jgi:hypothetical protein
MAKPLQDRLDAINARLGEIAEGKNLPQEEATSQTLPPEIESLDDNEFVTINYETFDEIPESLKSKANKIGGREVKYRKSILGIPVGKEFTSKTKEGYVVTAYGSDIKDAARKTLESQTEAQPTPQTESPQTLPEVENAIADLREQEQAENEETYNKYDEVITPLLEKEKELKAQASLEENGVSLRGVKFSDIVVDDKYLEDILDDNKLSDEEKKQVREVFTRGVTYFKFDKEGEQKFQEKFANPEDITDVADIITGVSAAEESNFNNYNTTNYENVKDAIKYILNNPNDYSPNVVKALTEIKEKLDNPSSSMSRLYAVDVMKELGITESTQKSEQAPQAFPAQEGATAEQEQEFKANPELEQVYRDLHAAVTKNIDEQTLRILKANPSEAMIKKAFDILQSKGVIKIDCN